MTWSCRRNDLDVGETTDIQFKIGIHKQNYMVGKLIEIQSTNMSYDNHNLWDPTENARQPSRQIIQIEFEAI